MSIFLEYARKTSSQILSSSVFTHEMFMLNFVQFLYWLKTKSIMQSLGKSMWKKNVPLKNKTKSFVHGATSSEVFFNDFLIFAHDADLTFEPVILIK